jgi:hypothetical protein
VRRRQTESPQLLPVAHQHVAARERKLGAILREASQNSKIALIHQLAAEMLHVARASFLLLIRAVMSQGAGRNRDGQQDERFGALAAPIAGPNDVPLTHAKASGFL